MKHQFDGIFTDSVTGVSEVTSDDDDGDCDGDDDDGDDDVGNDDGDDVKLLKVPHV